MVMVHAYRMEVLGQTYLSRQIAAEATFVCTCNMHSTDTDWCQEDRELGTGLGGPSFNLCLSCNM